MCKVPKTRETVIGLRNLKTLTSLKLEKQQGMWLERGITDQEAPGKT